MSVIVDGIVLGLEYRDTVSGFTGIAIGKTIWLNGCMRVGLAPKTKKDGTLHETQWFDAPQIEPTGKKMKIKRSTKPNDGGPLSSIPIRNRDPK